MLWREGPPGYPGFLQDGNTVRTLTSFRWRLVVAISAATLLTLGAAFAAIAIAVGHSQLKQLDDALRAEAREEAAEASQLGGDRLAIDPGPGPLANDIGPLTKYGAIYAPSGEPRSATPTFGGHIPALANLPLEHNQAFDLSLGAEHLRGVIVEIPGHRGHVLLLAAPRKDVDRDGAFLGRVMVIVFGLAVGWSAFIAMWVARAFTRDHQAITSVVRRVAAGDLSARVANPLGDLPMARLAADVNEMVAHLGAVVETEQRFVAQAAHELRSPLTTLYGELSFALRRARNAEAYRDAIREALDSTRRLKLLTEDLLALARGASEAATSTETAVSPILHAAAKAVRAESTQRGVSITVTGDEASIAGSSMDVERLLRNLLENAVRHSPEGGCVELACEASVAHVEISVSDEGSGVAEAERGRIFEPFYRAQRDRLAGGGGAGLGLAIVRGIAQAHGGDVRVEESVRRGARFVVRLPRAGAAEWVAPSHRRPRAARTMDPLGPPFASRGA